jgi:hypothetical protein
VLRFTPAQIREAAQILYPEEWRNNRTTALISALRVLNEASINFESRPSAAPKAKAKRDQVGPRPQEIIDLEENLKSNGLHLTAAARALGTTGLTLSSWFHGKSKPRPASLARIRAFLAKKA